MTLGVNPNASLQSFEMTVKDPDFQVNHASGSFGQLTITYHNGLDTDVYIADRNGAVVKLPANRSWNGKVSIQVKRQFSSNAVVKFESGRKVGVGFRRDSQEEIALKANYLSRTKDIGYRANGESTKDFCLDVGIDRINSLGGAFYNKVTDLVISLTEEKAKHPGSDSVKLSKFTEQEPDVSVSDLPVEPRRVTGVTVRMVDNMNRNKDKYVYLLGTIHRIIPEKDLDLESGIYISRERALNDGGYLKPSEVEYYPLGKETFESLGLFNSYEAAIHWVEELKESQELLLLKRKGEVAKAKHEQEMSALERKDYYDKVGSERKDHYDSTSTHRKDTSDEMKWVLGTVTVLVGVFALFLKR